jgi:hypothetical protein
LNFNVFNVVITSMSYIRTYKGIHARTHTRIFIHIFACYYIYMCVCILCSLLIIASLSSPGPGSLGPRLEEMTSLPIAEDKKDEDECFVIWKQGDLT